MIDDNGLIAESRQNSSSLIIYADNNTEYALTIKDQDLVIPIHGRKIKQVLNDKKSVEFTIIRK